MDAKAKYVPRKQVRLQPIFCSLPERDVDRLHTAARLQGTTVRQLMRRLALEHLASQRVQELLAEDRLKRSLEARWLDA